ncbi:pseudouridine synthase [Inhella sp.]|uniref:pseudouridine synthase n=1 Tax=Inhella sp. TaxID=1921806 RepID=UPI0035B0510C
MRLVTVDEGGEGQRLDNFLLRELKGVPKTHVYRVIRAGEVRVNKGRAQADTRLNLGDVVRIPPVRMAEKPDSSAVPPREFPILFEDEHLLVVDKPAGVAVHGGSGVSFGVIEQLRRARPEAKFLELVHRLDKETSGVLVLAKRRSALTHLQDQFRGRETGKTYAALVWGEWPEKLKVIDQALLKTLDAQGERQVRVVSSEHEAAKRSITLVKVVQRLQEPPVSPCGSPPPEGARPARGGPSQGRIWASLLDVTIKTGRTHQIRVHLASNGHAIVGDPKYGDFAKNRELARGPKRFERMYLHARRLLFVHPATGESLVCEAALPAECQAVLVNA